MSVWTELSQGESSAVSTRPHAASPIRSSGIARALELAREAGIPVAEILRIDPMLWPPHASRAEAEAFLVDLLRQEPLWQEFEAGTPGSLLLAPTVVVELIGDDARSDRHIVCFSSGEQALEDLACGISTVLSRFRPVDFGTKSELRIRPATSAWLHLGAEVITASFRCGVKPILAGATLERGGLRFSRVKHAAAADLAEKLRHLWPFAFDALLVSLDGHVRLADATVSKSAEERNTRLLQSAVLGAGWRPHLDAIVANCSPLPRPQVTPSDASEILARGQSHGDRWASGPLATSLDAATRLVARGERPVLVLDRLLPSQAAVLVGLAALGLRHDGPASHITILARTTGLPVVPRLHSAGPPSATAMAADGEWVTLSEAHGALFRGISKPDPSPVLSIASALASLGTHHVAIAATTPCPEIGCAGRLSIGLCRSEMQILSAPEAAEFAAYLSRIAGSANEEAPPEAVASRLEQSLDELLSVLDGALLNYRLMDADIGEVLAGAASLGDGRHTAARATARGPRWALASGFYAWQIQMAVTAAARHLARGSVDVVLTVPATFEVAEVRAVRTLFDQAVAARAEVRKSVRFGVMIETPRLCALAPLLADLAEVFSFGLNDLTASVYGLGREVWDSLAGFYYVAGLLPEDPFSALDPQVVAPLIVRTIEALRRAGAKGPIFLCGESANSPTAHALVARQAGAIVSVGRSDWPSATVSSARERVRFTSGPALEADAGSTRTRQMAARATAAARAGRTELAAELALEWFSVACPLANNQVTQNWKVLKKRLVGALFGELAGRFFMPDWAAEDVAAYVQSLLMGPDIVRISAFPREISCHARSQTFDRSWSAEQILEFVRTFDSESALHVFPQQDANQLCFRAVYADGNFLVEAGWGQAMYVFETERGSHPAAVASAKAGGQFRVEGERVVTPEIADGLRTLIAAHGDWLCSMGYVISRLIGVDEFAVEGYFDSRSPDRVVVVDIDLPLDIAWNTAR